jgi:hypothetical protein
MLGQIAYAQWEGQRALKAGLARVIGVRGRAMRRAILIARRIAVNVAKRPGLLGRAMYV